MAASALLFACCKTLRSGDKVVLLSCNQFPRQSVSVYERAPNALRVALKRNALGVRRNKRAKFNTNSVHLMRRACKQTPKEAIFLVRIRVHNSQ